jgi:hypothetical protein
LIPEGKYTAQCIEAKKSMVGMETTRGTFALTPKIVLKFRIIDGQYQEEEVPMFLNPITKRSHQVQILSFMVCKQPQESLTEVTECLEIFKNHIFTVGVVTVKPKYNGSEKPQVFWYSRVDDL